MSKNLSLVNVAEMTGVSKSTLSRIENGQVSPTLDTLEKIAKGINVSITELFESKYK